MFVMPYSSEWFESSFDVTKAWMMVSAASLERSLRILPIFLIEQKAAFDIAVTWQSVVKFESIITP